MLFNILNVIGIVCSIIGILLIIFMLVKRIRQKSITNKNIFISLFILLTGLNLIFIIFNTGIKINQTSTMKTSNSKQESVNLTLHETKKTTYQFDKRYINKIDNNGVPAFIIKPVGLKKQTTLFVEQKYLNSFLVPVFEKNKIIIKKY